MRAPLHPKHPTLAWIILLYAVASGCHDLRRRGPSTDPGRADGGQGDARRDSAAVISPTDGPATDYPPAPPVTPVIECPAGKRPCLDQCIDQAEICAATGCKPGEAFCGSLCVDAKNLDTCGSACARCPRSTNGTATCDGDTCQLACNQGFHRCGDECVPNTDPATCGSSCTPCPIPMGGEATCDGTKCGNKCPEGQQLCAGKCIPAGSMCTERCMAGQQDCQGSCVAPTDVNLCGPMCQPCKPPANGEATCNGTTCDFTCRPGFCRKGAECKDSKSIDSCGPGCEACPRKENATPTCNGTTCSYRCNEGFRDCGGVCKPLSSPEACGAECTACPAPANGKAVCNAGRCEFTCTTGRVCESAKSCIADGQPCAMECQSGQRFCKGACVPAASITAEKCDNQDNDCDGQVDEGLTEACSNKCTTANRVCRNGTWDASACPDPGVQCCNNTDCPASTCRTGTCGANGRCGVKTGNFCSGGQQVSCRADGGESQVNCGGRGCNTAAGTCCPDNTQWNGSSCAPDKQPNGATCTAASQCLSNRCTDGRCCAGACGACEKCIGAGGTCVVPAGTKVCNGSCITTSQCCGCNTSARCDGNRVVRGKCENGDCVTEQVATCGQNQACMTGSCVTTCSPGAPCNTGNPCTTGKTTCPSGCQATNKPDGTACSGGVCINGGCMICGGQGAGCCPNNTCSSSSLGCSFGRCTPCGRFHNDPCCGKPGDSNKTRCPADGSRDYPTGTLICDNSLNVCVNKCGEIGFPCCGQELCNDGVACDNGRCP